MAGCVGNDSKGSDLDPADDVINKHEVPLPPVYKSTGELFEADYAAADFPRMVEVLIGARGAEPNVGLTQAGSIFITAFDATMRSQDGGKSWQRVYDFNLADEAPVDPFSTGDPMLWVDPITDRIFTNHMFPPLVCASNIISDDDGESWMHFPLACGLPVPPFDHQKIATAPSALPAASPAYESVVYLCYNRLVSTQCSVSLDGGLHYEYETVAATTLECGGINGHMHGAPDGTLYVPLGLNCGTPTVSYTQDNGLTWTVNQFGHEFGMTEIDPEITVTPDGTAYYFARGDDGNGYLYRSSDHFATVQGPWVVNPPDIKGIQFAAMDSGDDGRLGIAYLGNREYAGDPSEAPDNTTWHLFQTFTYDADAATPTFETHQVTPPGDPVQLGCIWLRGGGGGEKNCRNLLDFIDGVLGPDGRFYVAFTDGCTQELGCADNANATIHESRSRDIAVAIQDHGPSLLESVGILESLGYEAQVTDLNRN